MTIENGTIEKTEYAKFTASFYTGAFGGQRFGQAFYNHFELHKLSDQTQVAKLHNVVDGHHARRIIGELFQFN